MIRNRQKRCRFEAASGAHRTMRPGDVRWIGAGGSPRNTQPGDLCEIESTAIGMLRNRVVAE